MKRRLSCAILGCAMALLVAGAASAQPRIGPPSGGGGGGGGAPQQPAGGLLQGTTLEITMQALAPAGFADLQIYQAQSGRRHVAGKVAGTTVSVIHQNCKEDKCAVILFLVAFGKQDSVDMNYINSWNREKLYAKMYKDEEENVFFTMDALLLDVPPQYITRVGQAFVMMLKHVYEYKPGQK